MFVCENDNDTDADADEEDFVVGGVIVAFLRQVEEGWERQWVMMMKRRQVNMYLRTCSQLSNVIVAAVDYL